MPKTVHANWPAHYEQIALDGTILRTLVGSTVHGLEIKGHDDRDEMGICIEPPDHVIGTGAFQHWVFRTQPEGVPSGVGDLDLVVYSLRKYARLCMKGSPTVLLPMYAPEAEVMACSPIGERLRAEADMFLSMRMRDTFLGYMRAQRAKFIDRDGKPMPGRDREVGEKGYDTKYAMHMLRIGHQGLELLETGRLSLPLPEPIRSHIFDVRLGAFEFEEIVAEANELEQRLRAFESSDWPETPDQQRIDRFLEEAYREAWGW